jgi:hypothetical protein
MNKKPSDTNPENEDLMDDPVVAEDQIPSYKIVEEKIRQIDNNVIIVRIFYLPSSLTYRFQLIKKNKMCMMEIPKRVLDHLKTDGSSAEEELKNILKLYVQQPEYWVEG